ncbi:MAG: hypothetical protein KJ935_07750 [Candidatus Omnitrophica bacterium]|nr:hypothetical protein [Candidatus Omnitrophota bacterium]
MQREVELTPEEDALIKKAKIGEYVLTSYKIHDVDFVLKVNGLISGMTSTVTNVQHLLDLEEEVKNSCQNLKLLLEVIESFGGEEVIDF